MKKLNLFLNLLLISILVTCNPIDDEEHQDVHSHPFGHPLSLMSFGNEGEIIVNNDGIDEIFMHPDVKDRKIVAVSIIGAFRKGKSFLMDYALRYMYGNVSSTNKITRHGIFGLI
jgi:hypothetical protein